MRYAIKKIPNSPDVRAKEIVIAAKSMLRDMFCVFCTGMVVNAGIELTTGPTEAEIFFGIGVIAIGVFYYRRITESWRAIANHPGE